MKPGFPATDLLTGLLQTSLDSHASFTCERAAKPSDFCKTPLETYWWKILFVLKFQGKKVQENRLQMKRNALSQHCNNTFGMAFYIVPTGYTTYRSLEISCKISCSQGTGKRLLSVVSDKSEHTFHNCFLFSPKALPVMGALHGGLTSLTYRVFQHRHGNWVSGSKILWVTWGTNPAEWPKSQGKNVPGKRTCFIKR